MEVGFELVEFWDCLVRVFVIMNGEVGIFWLFIEFVDVSVVLLMFECIVGGGRDVVVLGGLDFEYLDLWFGWKDLELVLWLELCFVVLRFVSLFGESLDFFCMFLVFW